MRLLPLLARGLHTPKLDGQHEQVLTASASVVTCADEGLGLLAGASAASVAGSWRTLATCFLGTNFCGQALP